MPDTWTPDDDEAEDDVLLERAAYLVPETEWDLEPEYTGIRTQHMKRVNE